MENGKKIISVVVPIYNEEKLIDEIYERITKVFQRIEKYNYEIVFFDDGSTDSTRTLIEELCKNHSEVKGVFYTKNFGYLKNTFYCMQQAKGDCAIIIHADLQNPPELIPEFIEKWENGAQVVQGIKTKSHENKIMFFFRTLSYHIMIKIFGVKMVPHATEYELFDKSFIEILGRIKTNNPFLRGIISEYSSKTDFVKYIQDKRKKGKSKFNFNKYYDFAICGIAAYSSALPRKVIIACLLALVALAVEFFAVFFPEMHNLDTVSLSNSIILRALFIASCLFIILVCVLLEFVISIRDNSQEKPLVVEEKRINY